MSRLIIVLGILFSSTTFAASPFDPLRDLSGKTYNVPPQSNVVFISFWATWCRDCKHELQTELPELQKVWRNLAVATVNLDQDAGRAKNYAEKNGIKFPVLRDPTGAFRKSLKVFSVPHWALYRKTDNDWILVDSAPAYDADRIKKALETRSLKKK